MRGFNPNDLESVGVRLDEAYSELPRELFALWIRMTSEPAAVLRSKPFTELCGLFGYKPRGFYMAIRRLKDNGYLRTIPVSNGTKNKHSFFFAKRPMITPPNQFVRL